MIAPPAASAATPFTYGVPTSQGAGLTPNVAVDANGTAHFVYSDFGATPPVVKYCRVPRGGTTCVDTDSFGPVGTDAASLFGPPHVFLSAPTTVDVLSRRCCGVDVASAVRSTNGGASFGGRQVVASGTVASMEDATKGLPDGSYSWISHSGANFQNGSTGAPSNTNADLFTTGQAHASTVGIYGGNTPVAVYQDFTTAAAALLWRKYDGSGSLNSAGNWTSQQAVTPSLGVLTETEFTEGPKGLFLASNERPFGGGDDRIIVRKFTGNGFSAPTIVSTESSNGVDIHQDGSGRLHVIWATTNNDADERTKLRWRTSADGVNWGPAYTLNRGEQHLQIRVAAAPDGKGFATWRNGLSIARAIPLEPLPEGAVPPVDLTRPVVKGFKASPKKFSVGKKKTAIQAKVGTLFKWNQSENGQVRIRILKLTGGIKAKSKGKTVCAKKKSTKQKVPKSKRCLRPTGKGLINLSRTRGNGNVSVAFSGRTSKKKLGLGAHRAVITVRDAAGNPSVGKFTDFTVVKAPKKKKKKK